MLMTAVLQTAIVWGIEFMHSSNAIIGFLGVSFFLAVTIRESREDMPERPKKLIAGVIFGTVFSVVVISLLIHFNYILLG